MLWRGRRESGNVEDISGGGGGFGGFGGGRGLALGGGGCGTLIIIILALLFGVDPSNLLNGGSSPQQQPQFPTTQTQPQRPGQVPQTRAARSEDDLKRFVSVVLADTEDFWTAEFQKLGKRYVPPRLVLFSGQVRSACGIAGAAVGPFYCPADRKVYIDLSFYQQLSRQLNAPGDFAQAYVLAHEVGHHVQNLLGTSGQVDALQRQVSEAKANQLSVRLELQADFYAGMFARFVQQKGYMEAGDLEEAIGAANAVGDDRLQKQSQGYVVPDSFTHGTSAQRMQAFQLGYQTGDIRQGNTFFQR